MNYQELVAKLRNTGFTRVERDDRLLDVFIKETLEKGVELWEKWSEDTVEIVRIHHKTSNRFSISRPRLEEALKKYHQLDLKHFEDLGNL